MAADDGEINDYTRIIVDEARRRGVEVEVLDAELGELRLRHGGVIHHAFQSLSDLTTATAFRICDDKLLTRRALERAGLPVAPGRLATGDDGAFLAEHGSVVVKPCRGEGGAGISVGVSDPADLARAVDAARDRCERVLIEAVAPGHDLRVVVIDGEVVAASVRRPPVVVGDGERSIRDLIEASNADRAFPVPLDEITEADVRTAGHDLVTVLPESEELPVRGTANLHTGGTIIDVTERLHPRLAELALLATSAIGLPVAGVDLMVRDPASPEPAVLIEVNEQPGLANHEPRPTAQRYLDLLFPVTAAGHGARAG